MVHLKLLVMAHLKLLPMVNLKLLFMVNLKLLCMVNNRDRHSLVSNSSNNLLPRVSSHLQHNSRQLLRDSTGMPDELCRRNVLCLELD